VFASQGLAGRVAPPVGGLMPVQRVLLAALTVDCVLVLGGIGLAPKVVVSASGAGRVAADLGLLIAIGGAAVLGPLALRRFGEVADVCLWAGVAFAVAYDVDLLLDFSGHPVGASPYWIFVATALIASGTAAYRTRRLSRGILASSWALVVGTAIWSVGLMAISYAFWHTHNGYAFWLRDGAIDDFRHSGGTSLWSFLLQDIQGAVFFHPFLSLALGAACGVVGAAGALAVRRLKEGL
jgi:hypothetical protein